MKKAKVRLVSGVLTPVDESINPARLDWRRVDMATMIVPFLEKSVEVSEGESESEALLNKIAELQAKIDKREEEISKPGLSAGDSGESLLDLTKKLREAQKKQKSLQSELSTTKAELEKSTRKRSSVGTTGNAKYRNYRLHLKKNDNPFRPGSAKHESLEILRTARNRTLTWDQYKEHGGRNSHMRSAIQRQFVEITPYDPSKVRNSNTNSSKAKGSK